MTFLSRAFITKKNLRAGYGIWECVQQSTAWFIAPIHVAIRQFIHESWAIRPHIQVFIHVVLHCWTWHTKLWRSFPCRLHWGTFNGSGNRCTRFQTVWVHKRQHRDRLCGCVRDSTGTDCVGEWETYFCVSSIKVHIRIHWTSNQVYVSNPNQIMVAYWSWDGDFSATL